MGVGLRTNAVGAVTGNARVIEGEWPIANKPAGSVALVNHVTYMTREIVSFTNRLERAGPALLDDSAAGCRSGELDNQLKKGKLNTQPKQEAQDDRRRQRAEQAAFQFRRYALPRSFSVEVGGKIRHGTLLSVISGIPRRIYEF
jgi:hypothetical protein